jgi:hypothetical protein
MSAHALGLDKAAEVAVAQAKPGVAPEAAQQHRHGRRGQGSLSLACIAIGKLLTRCIAREVGGGWLQWLHAGLENSDATYRYRVTLPLLASSARGRGTR